mgnify:CR=1 FL=1
MMNPKAMEALRKARELFAEKADDIPNNAQPVEPIRKPRVVLLPTNAPKFTKETMKQEHKQEKNGHSSLPAQPKQIDAYVEMSVTKACEACIAKGITKPQDIAKETGKNVNQIYTSLWAIKKRKNKAKLQAKPKQTPKQQADVMNELARVRAEWDREPTPFEDAHYVVLKSREEYEKEIDALCIERNQLQEEVKGLRTIINYLERKVMV